MKKLLFFLFLASAAFSSFGQRTATPTTTRTPVSVRQATSNLKLQYKDLTVENMDSVALEVSTGNVPASLSMKVPSPVMIKPVCMACYSTTAGPKFTVNVTNSGGTTSESSFVLIQLYYTKGGKSVLIAETGKSAPPVEAGKTKIVEFTKNDFCAQVLKALPPPFGMQGINYLQAKVSLVEEINFSLK
jgi:hypothetical protein